MCLSPSLTSKDQCIESLVKSLPQCAEHHISSCTVWSTQSNVVRLLYQSRAEGGGQTWYFERAGSRMGVASELSSVAVRHLFADASLYSSKTLLTTPNPALAGYSLSAKLIPTRPSRLCAWQKYSSFFTVCRWPGCVLHVVLVSRHVKCKGEPSLWPVIGACWAPECSIRRRRQSDDVVAPRSARYQCVEIKE